MDKEFCIKEKSFFVLNGFDKKAWDQIDDNRSSEKNDLFVVSFIGAISLFNKIEYRDPTIMLDALNEFAFEHKNVEVRFIGVPDDELDKARSIYPRFIISPQVSTIDSYKAMLDSDVLIVLHTSKKTCGKYIVCGKLYDYIRSGKSVLSIGNHAEANNDLIKKLQVGLSCKNKKRSIKKCLEELFIRWSNNLIEKNNKFDVNYYSRENQNELFKEIIVDERNFKNG